MPDAFPAWVIPVVFGLMGACIGSFLNVVIYRMPRGVSVNDPARSFCPECGKPIPWFLNIPVLSWLALRGKSACCGTRISFRYCFVELLTALLFAAIGWKYADASTGAAVLLCLWTAMAIVIMFIDAEHLIVSGIYRRLGRNGGLRPLPFPPAGQPCHDLDGRLHGIRAGRSGRVCGHQAGD